MMKKISRKKFLQISSLGIAGLAFPTPFLGKNLDNKKYHIIILGTSLEALIFAQTLQEDGFDDFLLLDTKKDKISHENNAPILVKANEKQTLAWLEKQQIPYFESHKKGETIGKYELETSEKNVLKQTVFELQKMAQNINWQQLESDKKAKMYDKMMLAEWLENHLHTLTAHALFAHKIDELFACQTDEISLLYFLYFLQKENNFDILNNENQVFIVVEKKSSILAKIKKSFAQKTLFTKEIAFIDSAKNEFFIHTENEKITASQIVVSADFLENESKNFAALANIFSQQKMIAKTSISIKMSYEKAFWRDKNLNGEIISFSGLIKKTFDISLPNDKYANLLIFPDKDYFLSLEKNERKALLIDELTAYFGEKALSYIQYEEFLSEKQTYDVAASFFDKNKMFLDNKNVFLLGKMPTIDNELTENIKAANPSFSLC